MIQKWQKKYLPWQAKWVLAMMAIRIRQLETEADTLKNRIGRLEQAQSADRNAFEQKLADLTDRTKAAIDRLRDAKK